MLRESALNPSSDADLPAGPLAGLRVLEFGQIAAGPFCAMLLADLGADVVKVEKPDGGDDMSGDIVGGEWQEQTRDVEYPKSDLVVRMPVPARKPADR